MGVYTFSSKPSAPGERSTPDLLVRFQAVSRTQPCAHYRFMSVHSSTRLKHVRRHITKYFKNVYESGFIFLCKTKEVLKSQENKLTVFDILPKVPEIASIRIPSPSFQYPDVQYKKVWYNYDGKRYHCTCACVIFIFERSKVSHWPEEVLREELGASAIDGFAQIPTDIISWSGKLVECRGTPLHIFAALGNKEDLTTAIHQLQEGTTAKALTDHRGATPLHYAAANGKLDICEILVAGVGSEMIYHVDNRTCSPLHLALYRRKAATITYLIQVNSDLEIQDVNGNSCLDLLYQQEPKDIEFIASKLESDCVDNQVRNCLLYVSMINKKWGTVRKLVSIIQATNDRKLGTTFLHLAAEYKIKDVSKALLERGFDKSERDITGFLAFHIACKVGAIDQIRDLMFPEMADNDINKGIQLCIRYEHMTGCREIHSFRSEIVLEETTVCMISSAFHLVLSKFKYKSIDEEPLQHLETVASYLLPLMKSLPDVLNTYVFDCALYGASETLILLKSLGASFDTSDNLGRTPLHEAVQSNKLRCCQVLLKGGGNPNVSDWRGSSPLHYACASGNTIIVKCLMENQKTIANVKDTRGRTPLLLAAHHKKNDVLVYLLKNGDKKVDFTVVDMDGFGLLHYGVHLKENTLDLIVEKLSGKPRALVEDKSLQPKMRISNTSWIPKLISTVFHAEIKEDPNFTEKFSASKRPRVTMNVRFRITNKVEDVNSPHQFPYQKAISIFSSTTREKECKITRKIVPPPEVEYEICSGCSKLVKPKIKHKCSNPKDKRNKKTSLKPFCFEGKSKKKDHEKSAFFLALQKEDTLAMKKIRKLDHKAYEYRDNFGRNCLEFAIDTRSLRLVKAVVELCPDVDKSRAIQKVVGQHKENTKDSTSLQLLVYLISVGCRVHLEKHQEEIFQIAIENKNTQCMKDLVTNVASISDQTMVLAATSGTLEIVEPIYKKWKKNSQRKLQEEDILGVACSSKHLSIDVVKVIKPKENTRSTGLEERRKCLENICKTLKLPFNKRQSILGKLFFKKHPAYKTTPEVFTDIGLYLLGNVQDAIPTQLQNNQAHVVCECLQDCLEMKCYKVAEQLIKQSKDVIWSCELANRCCSYQRNFKKKIYNASSNQLTDITYLQNTVLLALTKDVPENILYLLLKNGARFFNSEEGVDAAVDLDIFQNEETKTLVNKIPDNMTKFALTITELIAGEKTPKHNVLKLWKNIPKSVEYSSVISPSFNQFVKTKEDMFLRDCYQHFKYNRLEIAGGNMLHVASGLHDTTMLKMVLKAAVPLDVNAESDDGITPLDVAVMFGHRQNYKILMDNNSVVSVHTLEQCCLKEMMTVGKMIAMAFCNLGTREEWLSWYKKSLHKKITKDLQSKSRLKIVQDVWSRLEVGNNGKILKDDADLVNACSRNDLWEVIEFFLEKAPYLVVNSVNQEGNIYDRGDKCPESIQFLCQNAPTSLVTKYLSVIETQSKHIKHKVYGEMILHLMIRNEPELIRLLFTQILKSPENDVWKDILKHVDKTGKSALHHAAEKGNDYAIHTLISKFDSTIGMDVPYLNEADKSGASPLWYALSRRNWKCAQMLLIAGSNPVCTKAVPDFDMRRKFNKKECSEKYFQALFIRSMNIPLPYISFSMKHGRRVFKTKHNVSSHVISGLRRKKEDHKDTPKMNKNDRTKTKKETSEPLPVPKTESAESLKDYVRTRGLLTLGQTAWMNRTSLLHVAYAAGDKALISQILEILPSALCSVDANKVLPHTFAVINGNLDIERPNSTEDEVSQVRPLIWKFLSTRDNQQRLIYSLSQSLTYFFWRFSSQIDESTLESRVPFKQTFDDILSDRGKDSQAPPSGIKSFQFGALDSSIKIMSLVSGIKDIFKKFFSNEVLDNFIDVFQYLPIGRYSTEYNRYLFLSAGGTKDDRKLLQVLQEEITSRKKDISSEMWVPLLMTCEPWVLSLFVETTKNQNKGLSDPVILDLPIVDILVLFSKSERETDKLSLQESNTSMIKSVLPTQNGLTIRTELIAVAVQKELWSYLEIVGHHTLLELGKLDPVWQTVMAMAAEKGKLNFLRTIMASLEVNKMSDEQKTCFTAFMCLASLRGQIDVVKFLVRNRTPLVCKTKTNEFEELLKDHYRPEWGVLEYAAKGNCKETFEFLLKCFKEDRNIKSSVRGTLLLDIATEKSNIDILKQVLKYMNKQLDTPLSREQMDSLYKLAVQKGREKFCMCLLEHQNTSLVVYGEDRRSSLHYAALYGMLSLAEKIVESRPEVVSQRDGKGLTPLDYAHAFGKISVARLLEENKAEASERTTQRLECYGWFGAHMNANKMLEKAEDITIGKKLPSLDILSALETGNDKIALFMIAHSKYQIRDRIANKLKDTLKLYFTAAKFGCDESLRMLLTLVIKDDSLMSNVMTYNQKGHTVLSAAVQNKRTGCVKILMEYSGGENFRTNPGEENILHVAVRTGDLEIVKVVDEKSNGVFRFEVDKNGSTPFLYAAALGFHNILAYLTLDSSLQVANHNTHTTWEHTDFSCLECILDFCIGWSKIYQQPDYNDITKRSTRPIAIYENSKRCVFERFYTKRSGRYFRKENEKEHLLAHMKRRTPKDCSAWKMILVSMGYKVDVEEMQEFILRFKSTKEEHLDKKMKRAMSSKSHTNILIKLSENKPDREEMLLSAAVCGNQKFLEHFTGMYTVDSIDKASLTELALAFGNIQTAVFLNKRSSSSFDVFNDLKETLPLRIKWIIGMEDPGGEEWTKSISEDPVENCPSNADFFLMADFSTEVLDSISKRTDPNLIIPQTLDGRKYTVDIGSFNKSLLSFKHDLMLRAYIASSHIYGRQVAIVKQNQQEKFKTLQSLKVACDPPSAGNLPKIQIDSSGNYTETITFTQSGTGLPLMVDNTLAQKSDEAAIKNVIITQCLPIVTTLTAEIFERDVTVRVDWGTLESRRRTGNYDTLLRFLSGDSTLNLLGGLLDVLHQCKEMKTDLKDMYDQQTVDFCLQPFSHINEIVVTYVDSLQGQETTRKPKYTAISDSFNWEFTYAKNTLQYNRNSFPLLVSLTRYYHLSSAIYNSVYRISNVDTDAAIGKPRPNVYSRPKSKLTLDIDLKSFGLKNGTMINDSLCQGVSREVDVIARECEGMLRLNIHAKKVVLRNSPSVQGTGISLQDSTVVIAICVSTNAKKAYVVENSNVRHKLEDIEDQQLFSILSPTFLDGVKEAMTKVTKEIQSNYGFKIQISLDDRRLMTYLFQRYRREMEHPITLVPRMMHQSIKMLDLALKDCILMLFDAPQGDYCGRLNSGPIPNGTWHLYQRGKTSSQNENSTFIARERKEVVVKSKKYYGWYVISKKHEDYYSCTNETVPKDSVRWKHTNFSLLQVFPSNENLKGLVSFENKLYKVTDEKAFHDVLVKFPGKLNFGNEILYCAEMKNNLMMQEKIASELFSKARDVKPIKSLVLMEKLESLLHSCFLEGGIERPCVEVDSDSFVVEWSRSENKDEARKKIEQTLIECAEFFESALVQIRCRFLRSYDRSCSRKSKSLDNFYSILSKISVISIKKAKKHVEKPKDQKRKAAKGGNPIFHVVGNRIEMTLTGSEINHSLEKAVEQVLVLVFVEELQDDLTKLVAKESDISTKNFIGSNKTTADLSLEKALFWRDVLYSNKNKLNALRFHSIKSDGMTKTFQMSGLQIMISLRETYNEDSTTFKTMRFTGKDEYIVSMFEAADRFIRHGENTLRFTAEPQLPDDINEKSFKIEIKTRKSEFIGNIAPSKLERLKGRLYLLDFTIPENMEKSVQITVFLNEKQIHTYSKITLNRPKLSDKVEVKPSYLKIGKEGWVVLASQHECLETLKYMKPNEYRYNRGNTITETHTTRSEQYSLSFNKSYKIYKKSASTMDNYWTGFHSEDDRYEIFNNPFGMSNGKLHVIDDRIEIKVTSRCILCNERLLICTPFKDVPPQVELTINKHDQESDESEC